MTGSTFTNNAARGVVSGIGGAIYESSGTTLTVDSSVFSGNSASASAGPGYGGALGMDRGGAVTMTNDTVAGNTASTSGGGIYDANPSTISNLTIADNQTVRAGGGQFGTLANTPLTIKNTIFNGADSCSIPLTGPTMSVTYSIDSGTTCGLGSAGDLSSTNSLLGPLQNNGGPTATMALMPGSAAANAADPACPPPGTDQRGLPRPGALGRRCDVGAFEVQAAASTPVPTATHVAVVNPISDIPVPSVGTSAVPGSGNFAGLLLGVGLVLIGVSLAPRRAGTRQP